MRERHLFIRSDIVAEREAFFTALLASIGLDDDGNVRIAPTESGNPAGDSDSNSNKEDQSSAGSLNASLPGQLEFFSAKMTAKGIEFEIIVTDD